MKTQPVHVDAKAHAMVKRYAKEKDIQVGEAASHLIKYAMDRRAALAKYRKKGK